MSDRQSPYGEDVRAKGWRFEVDTEKIKASETWLRAKTGALRGALLLLWSEAWQQTPCGSLPNDDELVALLIDMPITTFQKVRPILMRGWWPAANGRLYHDTITTRVLAMLAKRASDAERAATRRARNADANAGSAIATTASRVTHAGVGPEFDTKHQAPSTIPETIVSGGGKPPRASRKCPASFEPEDPVAWIAEHCPGVDWRLETEKFRDHTFKTALTDWLGAWRNWMRKAAEFGKPSRGEPQWAKDRKAAVAAYGGAPRKTVEIFDMEEDSNAARTKLG